MPIVEAVVAVVTELLSSALFPYAAGLAVLWLLQPRAPPATRGVGPTNFPFFGASLSFLANFDTIQDWALWYNRRNGFKEAWGFRTVPFGPLAGGVVVLVTPEHLKHVLKDAFAKYEKTSTIQEVLAEFLGDGIFTSDGPRWQHHRKVGVQMFSRSLLREGTAVAKSAAADLTNRIARHASAAEPFDLQELFYNFTIDTFVEIAFGTKLESQTRSHPFAEAFDTVQEVSNRRFANPVWKLCRLIRTPAERELTSGCKLMASFAADVIASKRRIGTGSGGGTAGLGPDLISRFVARGDMSNTEITDMVMNFIIAGRDTTAAALSWTVYELLENPAALTKLLAEAESYLADHHSGTPFCELDSEEQFAMLEKGLPYCKAVAHEALRLHPSVPKEVKYCVADDVLPDGTAIRPGTAVLWAPYAMGRDPTLWPDPLKFDPDRWFEAVTDDVSSLHRPTTVKDHKYPVFNVGQRLCIGRSLALLEIQLGVLSVLTQFELEYACPHTDAYRQSIVCSMKHGLRVTARSRVASSR